MLTQVPVLLPADSGVGEDRLARSFPKGAGRFDVNPDLFQNAQHRAMRSQARGQWPDTGSEIEGPQYDSEQASSTHEAMGLAGGAPRWSRADHLGPGTSQWLSHGMPSTVFGFRQRVGGRWDISQGL